MLATRQTVVMALIGAILWFAAALLIRTVEPLGALEGAGVLVFYAALIPGTVPFVLIGRRIAGLRRHETAIGVTVAVATATLLDGTALVLIPDLYGPNTAGAGAAILWGAGVALVLGLVMSGPERA